VPPPGSARSALYDPCFNNTSPISNIPANIVTFRPRFRIRVVSYHFLLRPIEVPSLCKIQVRWRSPSLSSGCYCLVSACDPLTMWNDLKTCYLVLVTILSVIVLGLGSHLLKVMNPQLVSDWGAFVVAITTLTVSSLPTLYVLRQNFGKYICWRLPGLLSVLFARPRFSTTLLLNSYGLVRNS